MKNFVIGIVILLVALMAGAYLIQSYYHSQLLGQWGGKFAIDILDDNRLTVQNIKLAFNKDGTVHYEINLSAAGQGFRFDPGVFSVNKASRTSKRYFDGNFHYDWFQIRIEESPRNIPYKLKEAYPPFMVDAVSKDPDTGKPLIKLSVKVDFVDNTLVLQGAGKNPVRLSKNGDSYNDYLIQESDDFGPPPGRPSVVMRRLIKSN